MEHEEQAERMEQEADKLEQELDRVGDEIDDARQEWEAKEEDPAVPGAQPGPGEEEESVPGVGADEEELSEEPGP
jgi:chromosome segregation ATPase